jgi:hypothetical protein
MNGKLLQLGTRRKSLEIYAMEQILKILRERGGEFSEVLAPEKMEMIKRVFDQVCFEHQIDARDFFRREALAMVILRLANARTSEKEIKKVAEHAISYY